MERVESPGVSHVRVSGALSLVWGPVFLGTETCLWGISGLPFLETGPEASWQLVLWELEKSKSTEQELFSQTLDACKVLIGQKRPLPGFQPQELERRAKMRNVPSWKGS